MTEETPSQEEKQEDLKDESQQDTADKKTETKAEPTLQEKYNELNDKYLRLYSEFDNFRRRTAKERIELFKNASEEILTELLPVLDDFERAIGALSGEGDIKALEEGVKLVQHKMLHVVQTKGLKKFDAKGQKFDPDFHEAITKIPAPQKKLKGRVVDIIEDGYMLNDKVLRYAKVVVGE